MPKGYANGMAADGRIVVTGGVIGWDEKEHLADGFVAQVGQTLANIRAILEGRILHHLGQATPFLGVPADQNGTPACNSRFAMAEIRYRPFHPRQA